MPIAQSRPSIFNFFNEIFCEHIAQSRPSIFNFLNEIFCEPAALGNSKNNISSMFSLKWETFFARGT